MPEYYKLKIIEEKFKSLYPEVYNDYKNRTSFLNNPSWAEIRYCIKHNITEKPICKICGNDVKWSYNGYPNTCCVTCRGKLSSILNKETLAKISKKEKERRQKAMRDTCLKKYGYDNAFKVPKIKDKIKNKIFEKYGVYNPKQAQEVKDIYKKNMNTINERIYKTKKKNHTFRTSKQEEYIFNKLLEKYPDTINQYKSKLYPYPCDFYIPSLDLYIEFQGTWIHGGEPYNPNNEKHNQIIEYWKQKSEELNFNGKRKLSYLWAIQYWTERDPKKRQIAKDNNLNWLEFFSIKSFDEWFNKQFKENINV